MSSYINKVDYHNCYDNPTVPIADTKQITISQTTSTCNNAHQLYCSVFPLVVESGSIEYSVYKQGENTMCSIAWSGLLHPAFIFPTRQTLSWHQKTPANESWIPVKKKSRVQADKCYLSNKNLKCWGRGVQKFYWLMGDTDGCIFRLRADFFIKNSWSSVKLVICVWNF